MGAKSVLVDGTRKDGAARQETYVAGATGEAGCLVRCYWRRGLPCQGNVSVETGMPFQTLGNNPCARAVGNASLCGMGGWVKILNVVREWGEKGTDHGYCRGRGKGCRRERRGGSRSSWRMSWKGRGRCASGGEQWVLDNRMAL